ncbi:TRSP domain-containing protein [Arthrobacter sp. NicSoilB8]|uniref:TRSP domain-containing protein n=1 Tax=Arthrobacter sp. NicSoilB8 TaxID=2830998 RepID=UPI00320B4E8E
MRITRFFGVAGRHARDQAARIAQALAAGLGSRGETGVLVLATEEFVALPLAVRCRLEDLRPDIDIRYSTKAIAERIA